MKRFIILLLGLQILVPKSLPQNMYPVDSIPSALRAGAKAVIRSSQTVITATSEQKSHLKAKQVITLMNENAEHYLIVEIPYDELSHVSNIKANAYDASGKLVWSLKSYNIFDMRDFSGPEMLSDERKKTFEFPTYNYPFTIEFSFEVTVEGLFLSSAYYLGDDPEVSIEESGLQYNLPSGMEFNYRTMNLQHPTDSALIKNKLFLTWKEENLIAGRQRLFAPSLLKKMPVIYATPVNVNLRGYKGRFDSWQAYGNWINEINKGRDVLDKTYADEALKLVRNIPQQKDKIKTLYEYMQKHTRYFYLAFGIGGYQTIPANEVAKNGYGDCKALSNYMKSLLKAIGIESFYTLVNAGPGEPIDIQADFPGNQFNHVILCVPDNHDTIWLECTDQTSPFNYLGSFSSDRNVLVVTPEGGKLLRTPSYGRDFNMVNTYSEILLYGSGDADIQIKFDQRGLRFDDIQTVSESKSDMRKQWLAGQIGCSAFDIKSENYVFSKNESIPAAYARYNIHVRDLAAKSSKLMFITPSLISGVSYIWEDPSEIELDMDYQRSDSVRIEIPFGYAMEYAPEDKHIASKFGSYSSHITSSDKYVYFTRQLTFNKASFPLEVYQEFYQFISNVATAERQMLVLKSVH